MNLRKIHYISGLTLSCFIMLHLGNHCCSVWGAEKHLAVMRVLRHFYRITLVESFLLLAVVLQIYSGLKLFRENRQSRQTFFDRLHIWSGLYLALFLIIHLAAIFVGRILLQLDTNFYFGVAGLNSFPSNLFFIPYYSLAVFSFFGHLAAIHHKKMQRTVLGWSPAQQSIGILLLGIALCFFILYGSTNHFKGVAIPEAYQIVTGKP